MEVDGDPAGGGRGETEAIRSRGRGGEGKKGDEVKVESDLDLDAKRVSTRPFSVASDHNSRKKNHTPIHHGSTRYFGGISCCFGIRHRGGLEGFGQRNSESRSVLEMERMGHFPLRSLP